MNNKSTDLPIGGRYGWLTIIKKTDQRAGSMVLWECQCDCGNNCLVKGARVASGFIISCGCRRYAHLSNKSHGLTYHPLYGVWSAMKRRCNSANGPDAENYHLKGIRVCEAWESNFEAFYSWAMNNGYKKGLQIDREKNLLGYSPENCRFVPGYINTANRSVTIMVDYEGQNIALSLLARRHGIIGPRYTVLLRRLREGMPLNEALNKPFVRTRKIQAHKNGIADTLHQIKTA